MACTLTFSIFITLCLLRLRLHDGNQTGMLYISGLGSVFVCEKTCCPHVSPLSRRVLQPVRRHLKNASKTFFVFLAASSPSVSFTPSSLPFISFSSFRHTVDVSYIIFPVFELGCIQVYQFEERKVSHLQMIFMID